MPYLNPHTNYYGIPDEKHSHTSDLPRALFFVQYRLDIVRPFTQFFCEQGLPSLAPEPLASILQRAGQTLTTNARWAAHVTTPDRYVWQGALELKRKDALIAFLFPQTTLPPAEDGPLLDRCVAIFAQPYVPEKEVLDLVGRLEQKIIESKKKILPG